MNTNTETLTREAWLIAATDKLGKLFSEAGYELPRVRVTMGWPHGGRPSTIGQCWPGIATTDSIGQIFISPVLADPVEILAVLAHELIHAINHANGQTGHGKEFAAIAKPFGLTGKMTSTVAGDDLKVLLEATAGELGALDHAAIIRGSRPSVAPTKPDFTPGEEPKSRSGKSLKMACAGGNDYIVSMSKSRFESFGAPICPCHAESMEAVE